MILVKKAVLAVAKQHNKRVKRTFVQALNDKVYAVMLQAVKNSGKFKTLRPEDIT